MLGFLVICIFSKKWYSHALPEYIRYEHNSKNGEEKVSKILILGTACVAMMAMLPDKHLAVTKVVKGDKTLVSFTFADEQKIDLTFEKKGAVRQLVAAMIIFCNGCHPTIEAEIALQGISHQTRSLFGGLKGKERLSVIVCNDDATGFDVRPALIPVFARHSKILAQVVRYVLDTDESTLDVVRRLVPIQPVFIDEVGVPGSRSLMRSASTMDFQLSQQTQL